MLPIITINYNGSKETIDLIKSLLLSKEVFNLIIVDNCSTNKDELKIIEGCIVTTFHGVIREKQSIDFGCSHLISFISVFECGDNLITTIQANENYGFSKGTNIGIKFALFYHNDANYICILNNDTIVDAQFASKIIQVLDSNLRLGAGSGTIIHYGYDKEYVWSIGGHISFLKATGVHVHQREVFKPKLFPKAFYKRKFLSGCFTIFRKEVLERIGLLDEDYFFGTEEFQYSSDISRFSNLVWVPSSKIYHKVKIENGHGSSHQVKSLEWQYNSYMNKIIFINKNKNKLYQFFWHILFFSYLKVFVKSRYSRYYKKGAFDYLYRSLKTNVGKKCFNKEDFLLFLKTKNDYQY